jgi:hypothetical protein
MTKPLTASGYKPSVTVNCERVLITLLRGLGPWKDSVFLIGGLTPRYLVRKPSGKTPHAGTGDVDIVVKLELLAETDAYRTLEDNLKRMGFERSQNERGDKLSWRWETKTEDGSTLVLELLADNPEVSGGKVKPLPVTGNVSALNIPHSSMVFDHYETKEISAELLRGGGVVTENVKHADIVSFTCLKAFAFDQRYELKDAHDIAYCIENSEGGIEAIAKAFQAARAGKHRKAIDEALGILAKRFTTDGAAEGYKKDGPVAVANFEIEGDGAELREARALRQREVSDLITRLLKAIG